MKGSFFICDSFWNVWQKDKPRIFKRFNSEGYRTVDMKFLKSYYRRSIQILFFLFLVEYITLLYGFIQIATKRTWNLSVPLE